MREVVVINIGAADAGQIYFRLAEIAPVRQHVETQIVNRYPTRIRDLNHVGTRLQAGRVPNKPALEWTFAKNGDASGGL
jgi:hypothetical protein